MGAHRLGRWAQAELGEKIIDMATQPLFLYILLAGASVAIAFSPPPGNIVWLTFGLHISALVLRWMAVNEGRYKAIQP